MTRARRSASRTQDRGSARRGRRGGQGLGGEFGEAALRENGRALGDALAGEVHPADELAVADLDVAREVEGLVRELAGGVVLAADGPLAGVGVDVLDAAAVLGGERLHAAVRVVAPGSRSERAVAGDGGELAGGVVVEGLVVQARGGVGPGAVVGERVTGVPQQVAVVAVMPGLRDAGGGVADQAVEVVVDEGLRQGQALGGEDVGGLGELAGGVVAVGQREQAARGDRDVLTEDAAVVVELAGQLDAGGQREGVPAGERVVLDVGDESGQRALEAAGRVVVVEGAAVRVDVAEDAVLGVVDLAGREGDGAAGGVECAGGGDDAAAGVVREVDAARVVVHVHELAAGERFVAVVAVPDLADLLARGAVAALVEQPAERVEGPDDARAGRGDALGDAAGPVEVLA
jgi:hypothetical protein